MRSKIGRVVFFLVLIASILAQIPAMSQSKKYFIITGKIMPEVAGNGLGSIDIVKDEKEKSTIEIPKNGRFRFELEFFSEYTLTFKYPEHFNKIIQVSTMIPDEVWKRDNDFPSFPMIVQLTKEFEGVDKSFTLKPSGRIFYGKESDNFEKESFINEMQFTEQSANAQKKDTEVAKETATINKANAQDLAAKQKEFDVLIKEADAHYQRGEYQMALLKYLEAKKLFPDKAYPNDRVSELQDLVKALENTEKQKAELDQKYKSAIAKANALFDQKNYQDARPVYEEALQFKPGDVFANGRINEIDQILALLEKQNQYKNLVAKADENYKSKKYSEAIGLYNQAKAVIPEEKYPQAQIDLINNEMQQQAKIEQLEKEFNQAMQLANGAAQKKDFVQALNGYQKALELKPDNQLAKDKIAEINKSIVDLENDKKYAQAIQLADQALARNDLNAAKLQYQEALKVKQDAYPKTKLAEIAATEAREIEFNNLVAKAEQSLVASKLDDALGSFLEAQKIKPSDASVKKRIEEIQNLKNKEQANKEYTQLIAQADQNYNSNLFDEAISGYKKALDLKKDEAYPKEQLQKIESYQTLLKKAEKSYMAKDYPAAMLVFNNLLEVKPKDSYAQAKIEELKKIEEENRLQAEKEKAAQLAYENAVKAGDQLFASKSYVESVNKFKEALALKPAEAYPGKRIKEIEDILDKAEKERAKIESDYKAALALADNSFEKKDYPAAIDGYRKAQSIKSEEEYPRTQIQKIDQLMSEIRRQEAEALRQQQQKTEAAFNEAMASGDKAFNANDFTNARTSYETALSIKPNDPVAKKKFGETEAKIAQLNRNTIAYNKAITEANNQLTAKKYPEAKEKYEEALQYLPDSDYPKRQIAKIDELLAQQAAELKTRQDFDLAVLEAEKLFKNKEYAKAKDEFTKAYNLIPSEPVPPRRIAEINGLLADQERNEAARKATLEAYQAAIKKADNYFGANEYNSAKLAYSEALLIKSDEKYPQDQIDKIEKLVAEQAAAKYKSAIAQADKAFDSNLLDVATTGYQEALSYKKDDQYATQRLKDIEKRKRDALAEADRLKKLDTDFSALIADANNDFGNKNYLPAKEKYQKALTIKPNEVYPKDQITKIDGILSQMKRAEEINTQYAAFIQQAEAAFKENKLKEARDLFQKGYNLKPFEPLPPMRIGEIDQMLQRQSELAQLAAQEEAQRKAKEKADRDMYDKAIAEADKDFAAKKYQTAKVHYNEALLALPNEKYPKDQIAKINELVVQEEMERMIARQQAQQDSMQRAKDQLFEAALSSARQLEQDGQFEAAIAKYNDAIRIKPDQRSAIQKFIDDLQNRMLLAAQKDEEYKKLIKTANEYYTDIKLNEALSEYQKALNVKPEEGYPKEQIKKIQEQLAAQEQKYTDAIVRADKAYQQSDWTGAKSGYMEALNVKPNEEYPANRLKEVNQKIADLNLAALSKAAEDKAYAEAMEQAEKAFRGEQYTTARLKYQEAQVLKPSEELPPRRIREIDALIDQRNKERLAAQQRELDEKYRQTIVLADNSYKEKTYNIAKLQYQQASLIKPDEQYPKTQIALMDKLMNEAKPQETYVANLPKLEVQPVPQNTIVYNPQESSQATAARAESYVTTNDYGEAIKKADASFGVKDYTVARFYYYKALDFKPEEEYPKKQIDQIRKLIDSQMSSTDISDYDKAIAQADAAFSGKNYVVAKFFYYKALDIKSWEKYPKDRIAEIMALTNSLLSEKEEKAYREAIAKADEAYFNKDIAISRFYYNKALTIKKDEEYPKIKLKDIQKLIEQDLRDKANQEYKGYIELGDQALQAGNYSIARFNYNKALTVKPEERYPRDQIRKINEAINQRK